MSTPKLEGWPHDPNGERHRHSLVKVKRGSEAFTPSTSMGILLRSICSLVLAVACMELRASEDARMTLDFAGTGGLNLSPALLNQSLRSPQFEVRLSYRPIVGIPGISAKLERCGFLSLPCLTDIWKEHVLPKESIKIGDTNSLELSLPESAPGAFGYRLDSLEIVVPSPWDVHRAIHQSLSFRFEKGVGDGMQRLPFQGISGPYVLRGSLRFQSRALRVQVNNAVQSTGCDTDVQPDGNGGFVFGGAPRVWAYNSYMSGFMANDWLVDKTPGAERATYSGAMPQDMKESTNAPVLRRVTMRSPHGVFEAMRVERDAARDDTESCKRVLGRDMLFLDGKLLSITSTDEPRGCAAPGRVSSRESVEFWDGRVEKYYRSKRLDDRETENVYWHRLGDRNPESCGPKRPPAPPTDRVDALVSVANAWRSLPWVTLRGIKAAN